MKRKHLPTNSSVAIAYLRVSTTEQELGPEAQRAAIERWATQHGVTVVAWYVDQGISGGAELDKRPGLQLAIDDLEPNDAGVLIVAKRDRLARDVVLAAIIERLVEKKGAKIVSAAGEGGDDVNDPSSMLMRRIVDAFAEYERALIRSRTRAALGVKKKRGERVGNVAFGFRLRADGRTLEVDDQEQATIRHMLGLRAAGVSVRRIVAQLESEGVVGRTGKPLCKSAVENVIRIANDEAVKEEEVRVAR